MLTVVSKCVGCYFSLQMLKVKEKTLTWLKHGNEEPSLVFFNYTLIVTNAKQFQDLY